MEMYNAITLNLSKNTNNLLIYLFILTFIYIKKSTKNYLRLTFQHFGDATEQNLSFIPFQTGKNLIAYIHINNSKQFKTHNRKLYFGTIFGITF